MRNWIARSLPKLFVAVAVALTLAAAPAAFAEDAADAATPGRFDIFEYEVAGNSLLPQTAVEAAVYPHLGPGKVLADVEQARAQLEQAYRDAGYHTVLVGIPEQRVNEGVVRLEVTEGRIDRLRVTGSRYYDQGRIRAEAPAVVEGTVPRLPEVQKDIARLNRMPGRRVTPVLKPGREPGTTEIELAVEDQPPYGASLELNNNYSPNTEELRLTAAVHYDNLFQRQHALSLQYQTSPQDTSQVKAITASYMAPLWQPGEFLSFYVARSDSEVAVLSTTSALGKGDIAGLRWIVPLPGSDTLFHGLTLGVDYKDFKESLVQPGQEAINTPLRYVPFSASYGGLARDAAGEWEYSTGLVWAFRGVGSDENTFTRKRYGGYGNFVILKWSLARTEAFGKWGSLYAAADGQFASHALVSNEQYSAGGADSVRGYLQSEVLGDTAYRGVLEYRGPSLTGDWAPGITELRAHVFLDGAHLVREDALPGEIDRHTISSTGVGLRLRGPGGLQLATDVAWPIKETTQGTKIVTQAWDPRVQFSLRYAF